MEEENDEIVQGRDEIGLGGGGRVCWRERKQLLRRDALHKQSFGNLVLARSLLRAVLPLWLVERIDWETLRLEPTDFASFTEGDRALDLLFRVECLDGRARRRVLYILLEHQSQGNARMPLRMGEYKWRVLENHMKQESEGAEMPWLYGIVLHQSRWGWTVPQGIAELAGWEEVGAVPSSLCFADVGVDSRYQVVDLAGMNFEELLEPKLHHAVLAVMKLVEVRDPARWCVPVLELVNEVLRDRELSGMQELLLDYLFLHADKLDSRETLRQIIRDLRNPEMKRKVMSIAEQLMEEGRLEGWETGLVKGREEGRLEGWETGLVKGREEGQALSLRVSLRRILRHRFGDLPGEAEAMIEGATAETLTAWIDVALDAPTMAQACAAFRGDE